MRVDAKRVLDIAVSGVGLAASAPLLALIAVAVRLDSPGPVLFGQERIGRGGEPFRMHKFRSMRHGCAGPALTAGGDPRVTRVGRLLRRSKLDELPQLADVLVGRMSLVGPRPELARYVAEWPDEARKMILSVRPGITDPASIEFRNEAELLATAADPERYYLEVVLPRKVALYLDYVDRRTVGGDLRLIARTLRAVATG